MNRAINPVTVGAPSANYALATAAVNPATLLPDQSDGDDLSSRMAVAMVARDAHLDGHRCASVLVPVPAWATTSWKMEVAVVAASDGGR